MQKVKHESRQAWIVSPWKWLEINLLLHKFKTCATETFSAKVFFFEYQTPEFVACTSERLKSAWIHSHNGFHWQATQFRCGRKYYVDVSTETSQTLPAAWSKVWSYSFSYETRSPLGFFVTSAKKDVFTLVGRIILDLHRTGISVQIWMKERIQELFIT